MWLARKWETVTAHDLLSKAVMCNRWAIKLLMTKHFLAKALMPFLKVTLQGKNFEASSNVTELVLLFGGCAWVIHRITLACWELCGCWVLREFITLCGCHMFASPVGCRSICLVVGRCVYCVPDPTSDNFVVVQLMWDELPDGTKMLMYVLNVVRTLSVCQFWLWEKAWIKWSQNAFV